MKRKLLAVLLMLAFTLTACGEEVKPVIGQPVSSTEVVSEAPAPSSEPIKEPSVVSLLGVGDDLIHPGIYMQAAKRAGGKGYDFLPAYANVADIIQSVDIASINQETLMSEFHSPAGYPMFNSPQQLGEQLVEIGFDAINLANNHSYDKGEKGALSTLDFWGKQGVATFGMYKSKDDYDNIRTITKKDITFSFIGMTESTNGLTMRNDADLTLMRTSDDALIEARIKKAKEISDIVIINVHWGVEYTHTPNETQKTLAKKMIDWGADVILGHHPHVIQPVEYIERADGTKGLVVYSLGNFISSQDKGPRMLGGMLDLQFTKEYKDNTISLTKVHYIPVVTQYEAGYANIRVYPLEKYTKELANAHGVRGNSPDFSYDYLKKTVDEVIAKEFL